MIESLFLNSWNMLKTAPSLSSFLIFIFVIIGIICLCVAIIFIGYFICGCLFELVKDILNFLFSICFGVSFNRYLKDKKSVKQGTMVKIDYKTLVDLYKLDFTLWNLKERNYKLRRDDLLHSEMYHVEEIPFFLTLKDNFLLQKFIKVQNKNEENNEQKKHRVYKIQKNLEMVDELTQLLNREKAKAEKEVTGAVDQLKNVVKSI